MKKNLLDYDLNSLTAWFAEMGEKPFRAKQVMRWMHWVGAADFAEMTDLANRCVPNWKNVPLLEFLR